jgi:hypothetical protein
MKCMPERLCNETPALVSTFESSCTRSLLQGTNAVAQLPLGIGLPRCPARSQVACSTHAITMQHQTCPDAGHCPALTWQHRCKTKLWQHIHRESTEESTNLMVLNFPRRQGPMRQYALAQLISLCRLVNALLPRCFPRPKRLHKHMQVLPANDNNQKSPSTKASLLPASTKPLLQAHPLLELRYDIAHPGSLDVEGQCTEGNLKEPPRPV